MTEEIKAYLVRPYGIKVPWKPQRWLIADDFRSVIRCVQTAGYREGTSNQWGQMEPGPEAGKEYSLSVDRYATREKDALEALLDIAKDEEEYQELEMTGDSFDLLADSVKTINASRWLETTILDSVPAKEALADSVLPGLILPKISLLEDYWLVASELRTPENMRNLRAGIFYWALNFRELFPEYLECLKRQNYEQDFLSWKEPTYDMRGSA